MAVSTLLRQNTECVGDLICNMRKLNNLSTNKFMFDNVANRKCVPNRQFSITSKDNISAISRLIHMGRALDAFQNGQHLSANQRAVSESRDTHPPKQAH